MKMICKLVCFIVLLCGMNACSAQDSFTIKCEVAGLEDGAVMALVPGATHKDEKPLAEATVTDGKFSFTASVESPRLFSIRRQGLYGGMQVMVQNGDHMKIIAKAAYQGSGSNRRLDFENAQVSGSSIHEEYLSKTAFRQELDNWYEEINVRHKDILEQYGKAWAAKDKALMDSLRQTEAYLAKDKDENEFFTTAGKRIQDEIMANGNTWWGPFLMLVNCNWFEEEHKGWFETFSPEAQDSYYGKIVYNELNPETLEGKPAPAFTVQDGNGASFNLQQLMAGKKYLLLDFWASWCGPCRKEIPNLKAVYEKFAPKGLEIVSISIDKDAAAWQKALEEERLPWRNFRDETGVADAYSVSAIPAIFLVDGSGTIIATGLRGTALQEKLETLLP